MGFWFVRPSMNEIPADPPCPVCGAPVPLNARGCGRCGARKDLRTGAWEVSPDLYDGLDLPDLYDEEDGTNGAEDFNYDDFVAREFQENSKLGFLHHMTTRQRFWWLVAVITFLAFAWLSIVSMW